jgi:Ceramidase
MTWSPGTVTFCEERLCAWVAEPSNAWSSCSYIACAAWLFFQHTQKLRKPSRMVAWAALLVGLGSFFFHSSGTFAGEWVDQAGMFMLSCLLITREASNTRHQHILYVFLLVGSLIVLSIWKSVGIGLFSLELALGVWRQLRFAAKLPISISRFLYTSLGLFAVSLMFWLGDISRVLCDPQNHLVTGHALWHLLNAVSMLSLALFFGSTKGFVSALTAAHDFR